MKKVDLDLHKYPAAIRFKFLEFLGIKQKTVQIPKGNHRLNLVEHFRDNSRTKLKERTEWLRTLPHSEGNVVSDASRSYQLTSGKRPFQMLKFHNSSQFVAIVIRAVETKTKGTFNLEWGLLAGDRPVKKDILRKVDGKEIVYGGKTFAVTEEAMGHRGEHIIIECETFNSLYDMKTETYDFSAWCPRFLGKTDKKPDTIGSAESKAIQNFCFQGKLKDLDGRTHYLPGGKSGEEFPSK